MAFKFVKSHRSPIEVPRKGKAVILRAEFTLKKSTFDVLTRAQITKALTVGTKTLIRKAIQEGIRKEYNNKSGLRKISGDLFKDAQIFSLKLVVRGNKFIVTASWNPKLEYFLAQLFGVTIKHKNLFGKGIEATIVLKKRNFLALRKLVRVRIIERVIDPRLETAERLARRGSGGKSRFKERKSRERKRRAG